MVLGEESGCVQNDGQSIQGSLAHGNGSLFQILQTHLVLPAFETISSMYNIVQSLVVDVEGGNDDNNGWDSLGPYNILDCNYLLIS